MARRTLYNKIWDTHKVATLPTGQDQIFIGLHLIHEVTSPQAFAMVKESNANLAFPEKTFATIDHIIPTDKQQRPFTDEQAELMAATLEKNVKEHNLAFFNIESGKQGIVHIVGPEQGLTQPGITIVCGDSHTSTHGAFGAIAMGIGTSQVRTVFETQSIAISPFKVRKIVFNGTLKKGCSAKDVILKIIQQLGVNGGLGYAYEYTGTVFEQMNMDERMTVCNMSIEGGARIGYINPDEVTFDYIKDKPFAPKDWGKAKSYWTSIKSDADAEYDDIVNFNADELEPMVTWGITPGQAVGISETLPDPEKMSDEDKKLADEAYSYMKLKPGQPILGVPVNTVFIGSCTNGRLTDLKNAARVLKGKKVKSGIRTLIVPGSQIVKKQAEEIGLDKVFKEAGAEWREPGCSMCLAMNPDKLNGDEICASTSNRNFKGRQGSPSGRTLLMSPKMAAYAAINGCVSDVREVL